MSPGEKRGDKRIRPLGADDILLPHRPFLYTLDQIGTLLNVDTKKVMSSYVFAEGRSVGLPARSMMLARNIAPANEKPDWRVAEYELIRWMKWKGFKHYDRGYFTH